MKTQGMREDGADWTGLLKAYGEVTQQKMLINVGEMSIYLSA